MNHLPAFLFLLFLFVSNCQRLPAKLKQREGQDFLWHHQALPHSPCQRCPPHRKPGVILKEDVLDSGAACGESAICFLHSTIWSLLLQCIGLQPSLSYSSEPNSYKAAFFRPRNTDLNAQICLCDAKIILIANDPIK